MALENVPNEATQISPTEWTSRTAEIRDGLDETRLPDSALIATLGSFRFRDDQQRLWSYTGATWWVWDSQQWTEMTPPPALSLDAFKYSATAKFARTSPMIDAVEAGAGDSAADSGSAYGAAVADGGAADDASSSGATSYETSSDLGARDATAAAEVASLATVAASEADAASDQAAAEATATTDAAAMTDSWTQPANADAA